MRALAALVALAGLPGLARAEPPGEEIRFAGAGELELAATLVLPDPVPEAGAPALLLLPGSGPTDRDGNQPPHLITDLLAQVADRLAAEGVASLRFDKRSSRRHWMALLSLQLEAQNAFLSYESFVGDARAGLAFLREREGIDATRVGILGHSEGGLLALQVAHDAAQAEEGSPPAALVLVGTGGVPLADLVRFQIARSVEPYPEEVRKTLLADLDRAIEQVVADATVPADLHVGLRPLFPANATRLLQRELAIDPVELAAAYGGPVLLLHGESDVQVPARESTERLRAALGARGPDARCDVLVVPAASHNMKPVTGQSDPGFAGDIVPQALDGLAAWVRDALGDGR